MYMYQNVPRGLFMIHYYVVNFMRQLVVLIDANVSRLYCSDRKVYMYIMDSTIQTVKM